MKFQVKSQKKWKITIKLSILNKNSKFPSQKFKKKSSKIPKKLQLSIWRQIQRKTANSTGRNQQHLAPKWSILHLFQQNPSYSCNIASQKSRLTLFTTIYRLFPSYCQKILSHSHFIETRSIVLHLITHQWPIASEFIGEQ